MASTARTTHGRRRVRQMACQASELSFRCGAEIAYASVNSDRPFPSPTVRDDSLHGAPRRPLPAGRYQCHWGADPKSLRPLTKQYLADRAVLADEGNMRSLQWISRPSPMAAATAAASTPTSTGLFAGAAAQPSALICRAYRGERRGASGNYLAGQGYSRAIYGRIDGSRVSSAAHPATDTASRHQGGC